MILLSALLTPDIGLIFWTTLIFFLLWTLLGKFAWKPMVEALKNREAHIESSLEEAAKAREEMAKLQSSHEKLLNEAKEERAAIIKEAKDIKDSIIAEAKGSAKAEAAKILADAKAEIENQKMAAVIEVKNLIGNTTINLAKQVLGKELSHKNAHESFIKKEIKNIRLN